METVLPRKHSVSVALPSAPSDALGIWTDSLSSPAHELLLFRCKAETTNSEISCLQCSAGLPVNVLFCFCIAGLLWCGKTCLQWRWWQTLCKLFGGSLFYRQHPLSFHQASQSAASTEDRCYRFFYFCSPCCEFHPLNCISCCGRNLGVRVASAAI